MKINRESIPAELVDGLVGSEDQFMVVPDTPEPTIPFPTSGKLTKWGIEDEADFHLSKMFGDSGTDSGEIQPAAAPCQCPCFFCSKCQSCIGEKCATCAKCYKGAHGKPATGKQKAIAIERKALRAASLRDLDGTDPRTEGLEAEYMKLIRHDDRPALTFEELFK